MHAEGRLNLLKGLVILALCFGLLFVSDRLVRVENQRDGLANGLCPAKDPLMNLPDGTCLMAARRTWFGHLRRALQNPGPAVSPFEWE